jgi:hypothetical protein
MAPGRSISKRREGSQSKFSANPRRAPAAWSQTALGTWYHLPVPTNDTSRTAQAVQRQVQRAMTGEQRLLMALEMSMFARELAKERIRREHPDWPEAQVARELIRLAFLPAPLPARLQ